MFGKPKSQSFVLVSNQKQHGKQTQRGIPQPQVINQQEERAKQAEELKQLELDLKEIYSKLSDVKKHIDMIKDDYTQKRQRYQDAKMKLEEVKQHKANIKEQMNGFLIMYEVKKEETLKELSKKLQSTERYKTEHTF